MVCQDYKSHTLRTKEQRITDSVFISTLQPTALLLQSFRLRLNCYTLLSNWQVRIFVIGLPPKFAKLSKIL